MIVIGEKLNSSIPSVYAAIEKKDSRFVSDLAVKQEEAGAHFLDINAGMFVEAEEEKTCGAAMVALCMDDSGVPDGVERRIELANILTEKLRREGFEPEDIYLDPMVRPVGSGEGYGLEAVRAIQGIRSNLPDVHIVCGLSNSSFGLPNRALIYRTFLTAAMTAGLDAAIMDPMNRELVATMYAAQAVLGVDDYCIEYLGAYRDGLL